MFNQKNGISPLPLDQLMNTMLNDMFQGVDTFEALFQNKKAYTNYPPSNILERRYDKKNGDKVISDVYYEVQLAVAGWDEEDFEIEIENEEVLKINGKKQNKLNEDDYENVIHHSIAEREFKKEYAFPGKKIDNVEVKLEKGLLIAKVYLKDEKENVKRISFK
jgi:HSP20 family molecular chaperone IbpA